MLVIRPSIRLWFAGSSSLLPVFFSMLYDVAMANNDYIADFNQTDGLPPIVVQKLNFNFRSVGGISAGKATGSSSFGNVSYESLPDKPSIESVELVDNKTFPDLGIFKTDDQGYDVSDDYTLTSIDISSLWANAVPIALGA